MGLDAIILTDRDIARTYADGEHTYLTWREAIDRFDNGERPFEITKALLETGEHGDDYRNLYQKVRTWTIGDSSGVRVPAPCVAISELEKIGLLTHTEVKEHDSPVLAFSYDNPLFDAVNLLASWGFWRGNLEEKPNGDTTMKSNIRFSIIADDDRTNLETLFNKFGEILTKEYKGKNKSHYVRPPSYLSRFFSMLIPKGNKRNGEILMPFYISDLYNQDVMDNVYEDEIPEDFDDKRRDVTRGFLSGFIYHRIGYRLEERGKRRVSGHLRQMAKKSDAGMQGLIMEELESSSIKISFFFGILNLRKLQILSSFFVL